MQTVKKGLVFLLMAVMLTTLFPMTALANEGEEGTPNGSDHVAATVEEDETSDDLGSAAATVEGDETPGGPEDAAAEVAEDETPGDPEDAAAEVEEDETPNGPEDAAAEVEEGETPGGPEDAAAEVEEGETPGDPEDAAAEVEEDETPSDLENVAVTVEGDKTPKNSPATIEEVIYNTGSMEITVGNDKDKAEMSREPYILFEEDGNCTIELEPDAFFPYEVQFTYRGETTVEWFMNLEDSVEIGGHAFYVSSQQTDPTVLNQIGFWVGGNYIPAYPEEKKFTNDGPGVMPSSMMPLTEKRAYLDMTGYLPDELREVSVSTVTSSLTNSSSGDSSVSVSGSVAAWAKWSYYDEDGNYVSTNDNYTLVDESNTIDLYDKVGYSLTVELIVGTADQLDLANTRYIVTVKLSSYSNPLEFSVYSDTNPRRSYVYSTYLNENFFYGNIYEIRMSNAAWKRGEPAYLSMKLNSQFPGLTATVYEGYYEKESDIPNSAVNITDQIWDQKNMAVEGGYLKDYSYQRNYEGMPRVTIVLKRDRTTAMVLPVILCMDQYQSSASVSMYLSSRSCLYADTGSPSTRTDVWNSATYKYSPYTQDTVMLNAGLPVNGTYYYNLTMYNPADSSASDCGLKYVQKAVVGYYETTAKIPSDLEDIKNELFSDASQSGGGYGADYSNGVTFTVVDTTGGMHWFSLKTVEYVPSAPKPLSQDTYFQMQGAIKNKDEDGKPSEGYLRSYIMPYDADSYYYNGYQTVFLLNYVYGRDPKYSAVTDEIIIPSFDTDSTVEMYAGHNGASGTKQISNETPVEFESGKAIQYSAAAENGKNLKNYWVTFVTQQEGAKLFVNAINDEDRYVTVADEDGRESRIPEREVFLTDEYSDHHDVFIANIGDEEITGLYVKLEDAENVALDDYWTIGNTTTLSAFTTTEKRDSSGYSVSYGELANVAKIRLVPAIDEDGNELDGEISGTLVIGYTGKEGEEGEEIRIHLTGIAGKPKITTTSIVDGVKYVPYSSVIQTNNMYQSDAITFSLSWDNNRPLNGVNIKPNGEIYGIPAESGDFTFTVRATHIKSQSYDERTYTIHIADNTDENVWTATDANYDVTTHIGVENGDYHYILNSYEDSLFVTEGVYDNFVDFWLDGTKLTKDVDYQAESGSTRITILSQTLKNAGSGTHTLAAEFREGGSDGDLKRAAQNYTVSSGGSNSGNNSSSSGSSSSGSGSSSSNGSTGDTSSVAAAYAITLPDTSNGSITVSSKRAVRGTVISVTVKPDFGYALDNLIISDKNGMALELTDKGNNVYTFTMPDSTVMINAAFVLSETRSLPFVDVAEDVWYGEAVKYVYERGLMVGTDDTIFSPNSNISRAMIATILYRMEGEPAADTSFVSDAAASPWYTDAMAWVTENNIITGYGNGIMGPDDDITREQMATVLYRYANVMELDVSARGDISQFTDAVLVADWVGEAMEWAIGTELFKGKGDGALDPCGTTSRAEMATVLMRFIEQLAK